MWQKRGLLWQPNRNFWWQQHYGILPTPEYLPEQGRIRLYFATACAEKFGRVSYIEVDADEPSRILYEAAAPILDTGDLGCFDDCGLNPSSLVQRPEGRKMLYYVGYQRTVRVPYMLYIGCAEEQPDGSWQRLQKTPLLDRSSAYPYSTAAPFVLFDEGIYKMWFWVAREWTKIGGKDYLSAFLAYNTSADGIHWKAEKAVSCISPDPAKNEFSLGRPYLLKDAERGLYRMWYSVRYIDKLYRIGYAESKNGLDWQRLDEQAGIDVSPTGWDSEMICYPAVVQHGKRLYLFYNGNNNGQTGFGWAEWAE